MGEHDVGAVPAKVYRVGDLVLDLGRQQLTRGADPIPLPGLSFALFVALARAAPDVLTVDQIMDQVWGRVIVSPETVSQRVKLLRDSLGDDPRRPKYITVVRGRGYRLLARVEPMQREVGVASSESQEATGSVAPHGNNRMPSERARILAASTVLVIAIGLAVIAARERDPAAALDSPADAHVLPAARDRTVAVLPFLDLDETGAISDPAAGLADAILNRLASVTGVNVIARRSSFAAARADATTQEIGRRLGARYLLDGTVQSDAQRLRVTASLADANTGRQVWSIVVERPVGEWLELQDEISLRVVSSMAGSIKSPVTMQLPAPQTSNPAARLSYLQANALAARERMVDLEAAIERYQEALVLDPGMSDAYAGLADAYLMLADLKGEVLGLTAPQFLQAADEAVSRALAIEPENGAAIIARAQLHAHRRRIDDAMADFKTGIELAPNDADGYGRFARFLFYSLDPFERPDSAQAGELHRERYAEALLMIERARRLDPLSARTGHLRGLMLLHMGRPDEAEPVMLDVLRLDPDYYPALGRLAQIRWLAGDIAEAIRLAERALRIEPAALWIRHYLVHFYADVGETDAADDVLREGGDESAPASMVVRLRQGRIEEAAVASLRTKGQPLPWDRDIAAFALRELLAIDPQRRAEVVRSLESRIRRGTDPPQNRIHHGSRFAALELAQIHMASESGADRGAALARDVLASIAQDSITKSGATTPAPVRTDLRQKAMALALLGEPAQAVSTLGAVTAARNMRHIWYDIERQPAFEHIRASRDFAVVRDEYRAWLSSERSSLARFRKQGIVPHRGATG